MNAQTQHTPGPWTQEADGSGFVTVRDAEGEFVTRLTTSRYHDERADPECEANNALMVAAPELLAAAECEEALGMPPSQGFAILIRNGWDSENRFDLPATEFVSRLRRAALAKARGEA